MVKQCLFGGLALVRDGAKARMNFGMWFRWIPKSMAAASNRMGVFGGRFGSLWGMLRCWAMLRVECQFSLFSGEWG